MLGEARRGRGGTSREHPQRPSSASPNVMDGQADGTYKVRKLHRSKDVLHSASAATGVAGQYRHRAAGMVTTRYLMRRRYCVDRRGEP